MNAKMQRRIKFFGILFLYTLYLNTKIRTIIATIEQISRIKLSKKISQDVVINTTKTVEVRGMKMKKVLFQLSSSQDGIVKSRKTLKGRSMRMKKIFLWMGKDAKSTSLVLK